MRGSAAEVPAPLALRAFFGAFTATSTGLYVIAAARIVIGLVFIRAAPQSRAPRVLRLVGIVAVALGVATALVSVEQAAAVLRWELAQGTALIRVAAAFWLIFGAFVTFAFSKRRAAWPRTGTGR